jgi:MFS family permease
MRQDLTCGLLAVFQYGLLTSAREIFNPRFNLTSAVVSGLFYLAPGAGFLLGSILGGRLSDRTVKRYIARRGGLRLPQDRLNSGLATLCVVLPIAVLVYGWTLQTRAGGMAVPVIAAFWAGVGLMGSFNGLNTYAAGEFPMVKVKVMVMRMLICGRGDSRTTIRGYQREVYRAVLMFGREQCSCCSPDQGDWGGLDVYNL